MWLWVAGIGALMFIEVVGWCVIACSSSADERAVAQHQRERAAFEDMFE